MSYVFMFLLGKGKDELEEILADVNKKLEKDPTNETLLEEKKEVENALAAL